MRTTTLRKVNYSAVALCCVDVFPINEGYGAQLRRLQHVALATHIPPSSKRQGGRSLALGAADFCQVILNFINCVTTQALVI